VDAGKNIVSVSREEENAIRAAIAKVALIMNDL
jgi:hypothetical protein